MEQNYYRCEICGNIITKIHDSGVRVVCCGQEMTEMIPGSVHEDQDEHVPEIHADGKKARVCMKGMEQFPAGQKYYDWICLQTNQGRIWKKLNPDQPLDVSIALCEGEQVEHVYLYSDMVGLLKI